MPDTALALREDTLEKLDSQIASGNLKTREEVIDMAVDLLDYLTKRQNLREALKKGEADVAAGRVTKLRTPEELKAFFDNL